MRVGGKERAEAGRVVSVCYLQRSEFLLLLLISGWGVDLGQTHYGLVAEAQPHHFLVLPSVSVGWEGSLLVQAPPLSELTHRKVSVSWP